MPIVYRPAVQNGPTLIPPIPNANSFAGARLGPGINPSLLTRAFANQQKAGNLNASGSIGFTRAFTIQFNGPGQPPAGVMVMATLNVTTDFNAVADATAGGIPFIIPPVVPVPAPASASGQTDATLQVIDPTAGNPIINISATAGPYSAFARFLTDTPGMKRLTGSNRATAQLQYNKTYQLVVYADSSCSATIGAGANFAPAAGQALIDVDSGGSAEAFLTVMEPPFELIPDRPFFLDVAQPSPLL